MKAIFVFLALGLTTTAASAGVLSCQLLKAQGGRVVSESKAVTVKGNVDIAIEDFATSDQITARVSGDQVNGELQLSIDDAQSGISTVTAYSPNNSLNLLLNGTRFALVCSPK